MLKRKLGNAEWSIAVVIPFASLHGNDPHTCLRRAPQMNNRCGAFLGEADEAKAVTIGA